MNLPSGRRRGQPVEVTYAYDKNGMMNCTFFDVKSGRRESVDLSISGQNDSKYDLDDVVNF
jgi:molecular chaperone DnaK